MLLTTVFAPVSSSFELLCHLDSSNPLPVSVKSEEDGRSYQEIQETVLFRNRLNRALYRIQLSYDKNSPILFTLQFDQEEVQRLEQFWEDYLKLSMVVLFASLGLGTLAVRYSIYQPNMYRRVTYLLFFLSICVFAIRCAWEKYLLALDQGRHYREGHKERAVALQAFRIAVLTQGMGVFAREKLALHVDDADKADRLFTENEIAFLLAKLFCPEQPELLFKELKKSPVKNVFDHVTNHLNSGIEYENIHSC